VRFGLCVANIGSYSDPGVTVRIARAAEEAGWEALFVWDHLAFVWGPPAADPWVTLAAVAQATERLRLGTTVTPVARRRVQVLAQQVATLDVLSGGRVTFAAGLGGSPSEFSRFGDPDDPRVRAKMLDEGLPLLRQLWEGEEVQHRGPHYTVDGVKLGPLPVQERLPIWVGGNRPPSLRRAARWDGWAASASSPEAMQLTPDDVRRSLEVIGRGEGFDVSVDGYSDRADPAEYADAGATWWLEAIHDIRGPVEEMLRVIEAGPPKS
jgi:probable F420-dependent oxidoreductase